MADERRVVGNKHIEALVKLMPEGVDLYQSAENHDLIVAFRDPVFIIRKNFETQEGDPTAFPALLQEQAKIIRWHFRETMLARMGSSLEEKKDEESKWLTTDILARLERIMRLLERRNSGLMTFNVAEGDMP